MQIQSLGDAVVKVRNLARSAAFYNGVLGMPVVNRTERMTFCSFGNHHDGPCAETKELIAGFWLWRVDSMEEAIEWVKRCPNPHEEECDSEIRPVFEADDCGDVLTSALPPGADGYMRPML